MNIHFGNQSQFELFPGTTGEPIENTAPRFIFSRVVLTFENLVVVFVFIIVSLIITFSVGVERGRRVAAIARPAAQVATAVPAIPNRLNHPQLNVTPVIPAVVRPMSGTAEAARIVPTAAPALPAMNRGSNMTLNPNLSIQGQAEKSVDKGYTIQVASYKKESLAQKEAMDLKGQGWDSLVISKGSYVIVCVGRFAGPGEAKNSLNKLKKRYKDCVIRSL